MLLAREKSYLDIREVIYILEIDYKDHINRNYDLCD